MDQTNPPDLKWYVVHTKTGSEVQAKASIESRIKEKGFEKQFGQVLVPTENVVEHVKGQKQTTAQKFFPGYIFVQMHLTEETWHLVKGSMKVSNFVGPSIKGDSIKPVPVPEHEVQKITRQMTVGVEKPRHKVSFRVGESVHVTGGPFSNFNGTVEEVHQEKGTVKVLVNIFGRPTPVELDFGQIEKS